MEKFSLEEWLKNKSRKVVTRHGRPVTIVCPKSPYDTIVGFCGEDQYPDLWDLNGKFLKDRDSNFDLFFADEKESINEFEARIYNLINFSDPDNYPSIEEVKEEAEILLDLARKEILKDLPKLEKTEDVIDPTIPVMYTYAATNKTYVEYDGHKLCINDAFKKLPKKNKL